MLIFGVFLLLGVMGFLAVCTYAVIVVPRWSSNGLHANVKAFRFLLFRFRLDSWWFGVLLLLRGPLMSLPIALATDYPPVQVMSVMLVFLVILIIQANSWPWKVPLLNVLDCFIGFCITMLVASNALYLGGLEGSMKDFADGVGSVIMGMMGAAVTLLFVMTVSALTFRAALGGQQELIAFNLQRTCFLVLSAFCNNSPLTRKRLQSCGTHASDHQSNTYLYQLSEHSPKEDMQDWCEIGGSSKDVAPVFAG